MEPWCLSDDFVSDLSSLASAGHTNDNGNFDKKTNCLNITRNSCVKVNK